MNVRVDSTNEFMSTLYLKEVTYENNGNYTCIASNRADIINFTAPMIVNGKYVFHSTNIHIFYWLKYVFFEVSDIIAKNLLTR